ncbi:hypothetical protein GO003_024010 [Methylicorpusculum oleiharenae]|jgi:hypothetical protein|uniref:hypothetical protein n=1 Tax=Methylicorpusculum oleiharenae TaxID=1338687 RepID=UPI001356EEC4|nr:hypothetical protein [Methylicorpusculum oleiharenae]MCD2453450.1 hypothetical protein [Methylicorpusculum oleiharenae]
MKKILRVVIGLFTMIIYLNSPNVTAKQNEDTSIIDLLIAEQEKQDEGSEYKDVREVVNGDLNNDGIQDTVVLYSIDGGGGGNMSEQYLAVFLRLKDALKPIANIMVGNTSGLYRIANSITLTGTSIEIETSEYVQDDARCCPSKKGKTFYVLADGKLKESSFSDNSQPNISSEIELSSLFKSMENGCEFNDDIKNLFSGLYNQKITLNDSLKNAVSNVESKKLLTSADSGENYLYKLKTKAKYYGLPLSSIEHSVGFENGIYSWSLIIDMPKDKVTSQLKLNKVNFNKVYNEMDDSMIGVIIESVDSNKTKLLCDISN